MVRKATTVGVTLACTRAERNAATSSVTIRRTASTSAPTSESRRSSARSANVTIVTYGSSRTPGSTSWGRARSITPRGAPSARTVSVVSKTPTEPVQAITRSAPTSSSARSARAAARTPYSLASRAARSGVRLTTMTSARAPTHEGGRGQSRDRAGSDDDRPAPVDGATRGRDAVEGGRDQGRRRLVDAGLGMGSLADAQGLLEQGVEGRADGAGVLPHGQGFPGLAEDLGLAHRHRVEPRDDLEEVGDGAVVVVDVEVRQQGFGGTTCPLDQQRGQFLDAAVEAVDVGVDLEPVAGGDHRRLRDVLTGSHVAQQLGRTLGIDGDALEQRHRSAAVGDAHDEDTHAVWAFRCSW